MNTREGGGREGQALQTQADAMNPLFAGILLGTLLGAALGKEAPGAPVTEARRPVPATPERLIQHVFSPPRKPHAML